jgi:ABC-type multidrug transport system ATPase subunit
MLSLYHVSLYLIAQNVLSGRAYYGETEGTVMINGKPGFVLDYRNQVGFVPQDDTVHEDLTVLENLQYSSQLRLPASTDNKTRDAIVADTLRLLQMEHIKDSIVGSVEQRGISGGQRKRVNIGLEMVADPIVLFLDEPTSGLDSTSSEVVLAALKDLTDLGLTVVTVIHQPRFSIFTRFDHVLLLGKGGKTVYSGPSNFALPYFQALGFRCPPSENPADFLMDAISGEVKRNEIPGTQLFEPKQLFDFWTEDSRQSNGKPTPNSGAAIFADLGSTTVAQSLKKKDIFTPAERHMAVKLFSRLDGGRGGLNSNQLNTMLRVLEVMIDDIHFEKMMKLSPESIEKMMVADVRSKNSGFKAPPKTSLRNRVPGDASSETFRFRSKKLLVQWLTEIMHGGGSYNTNGAQAQIGGGALLQQAAFMEYLQSTEMQSPTGEQVERERRNSNARQIMHISQRETPGVISQWMTFTQRSTTKLIRSSTLVITDLGLMAAAAALVVIVNGKTLGDSNPPSQGDVQQMPTKMLLMILFFGALSMIGTLRTFGAERLEFWRESSGGVNVVSLFLAKNTVDMILVTFKPFLFWLIYYAASNSKAACTPQFFLLALWLVSWVGSGYGYLVSLLVHPKNANLTAVMIAILFGAFMGGVAPKLATMGPFMLFLTYFSYGRWATEALILNFCGIADGSGSGTGLVGPVCYSLTVIGDDGNPTGKGSLVTQMGYSQSHPACFLLLFLGLISRFVSMYMLIYTNRDQQIKTRVSKLLHDRRMLPFPAWFGYENHGDGGAPKEPRRDSVSYQPDAAYKPPKPYEPPKEQEMNPMKQMSSRQLSGLSAHVDADGTRTLKTSNVKKYEVGTEAKEMSDASLNGMFVIKAQANDGTDSGPGVVTFAREPPAAAPAHDQL